MRHAQLSHDIETMMDEGISFMVQEAAKRSKAGQINHREFTQVINCALRWESLKRQLGIDAAPKSGAAIDEIRARLRKTPDDTIRRRMRIESSEPPAASEGRHSEPERRGCHPQHGNRQGGLQSKGSKVRRAGRVSS
jgi:hypothetical protein